MTLMGLGGQPAERVQQFIRTKIGIRRSLYANASYIMFSNLTRSVLGFAFWLIAARLYPREAVGVAGAVISTAMLIGTLARLGLQEGVIRFLRASHNPTSLINTSFLLLFITSAVIAVASLMVASWWAPDGLNLSTNVLAIVVFVGLAVGYTLFQLSHSMFIAVHAAHNSLILVVVAGIVKIGLLPAVSFVSEDPLPVFGLYGVGLLVGLVVAVVVLLPRHIAGYRLGLGGLSLQSVRPMFSFSVGNHLSNLLWMAPARLYPVLVVSSLGEAAAADFYIAWLLGSALEMGSGALATSLFAEGASSDHQVSWDARRTFWGGLLITGLGAVVLSVLARPVLLLFGEQYSYEAVGLVRLFSVAALLDVIVLTYRSVVRIKKRIAHLIVISAVRAVVGLTAGVALMARYDLYGVGIGWVGVQVVLSGLVVVLLLSSADKPLSIAVFAGDQ